MRELTETEMQMYALLANDPLATHPPRCQCEEHVRLSKALQHKDPDPYVNKSDVLKAFGL